MMGNTQELDLNLDETRAAIQKEYEFVMTPAMLEKSRSAASLGRIDNVGFHESFTEVRKRPEITLGEKEIERLELAIRQGSINAYE